MIDETPPAWKLPLGVNASLWRYTHTEYLAESEDDYFEGHPLFEADAAWIDARFHPPGRVVDLGCGVGRHSIRMARRGFDVTAVELSAPMLKTVAGKAAAEGLKIELVEANLCTLNGFAPDTFDFALSMFSTLGMIQGPLERQIALNEAARILKPGGRLALHLHNLYLNLRVKGARGWLARQLVKAALGRPDAGTRRMPYRGIPDMEVHLYRWGELKRSLREAGLRIDEVLPIHEHNAQIIRMPWFLHRFRAGGWMIFASKK